MQSQTPDASGSIDTDMEDEDEEDNDMDMGEGTSRGVVTGSIFLEYYKASGSLFIPFVVLLLFTLSQCAASLNDYFVSYW